MELEEIIEQKKRNLKDYLRIAKSLNFNEEDVERQVDIMLDDISKLMKKRN